MFRLSKAQRAALLLGLLVAAFCGVACGGGSDAARTPEPAATQVDLTLTGIPATQPLPKPDIVLTDTAGQPFDFRARTEGKITLLYFGYTFCPDICPTHMATVAAALKELPPEEAGQVEVVFVTIDPDRDTPEQLRTWLDLFNPTFVGARADGELAARNMQYDVGLHPATKNPLPDGQYTISHPTLMTVFSKDNLGHVYYPYGTKKDALAHDLRVLIERGWTS